MLCAPKYINSTPNALSLSRTPSFVPPEIIAILYPESKAAFKANPSLTFIVLNISPLLVIVNDPSVNTPSTSKIKVSI